MKNKFNINDIVYRAEEMYDGEYELYKYIICGIEAEHDTIWYSVKYADSKCVEDFYEDGSPNIYSMAADDFSKTPQAAIKKEIKNITKHYKKALANLKAMLGE